MKINNLIDYSLKKTEDQGQENNEMEGRRIAYEGKE